MFRSHQLYSTAASITRKFLSNNNNKTTLGPQPLSATGGTKTTIGSYTYHDFTSPGTFTVASGSGPAFIIAIGGGGGGSGGSPGDGGQSGGGAGGVIIAPLSLSTGSYPVVVGAGGAGGPTSHGSNGVDSTFGPNWVAQGGGGGAYYTPSPYTTQGGSPGGLYGGTISPLNQTNNPALPADSRTFGYGNSGGGNSGSPGFGGGGGGGAGGVGNIGQPEGPGVGGIGLPTSSTPWLSGTPFFSPTSQYFAGGGGGASRVGNSSGGLGGGGSAPGGSGTTNTGGGGGARSGSGGSGRVIIVYLT